MRAESKEQALVETAVTKSFQDREDVT